MHVYLVACGGVRASGLNFSLQLSSRTQFIKINNKKVIAENQCEKHKKSILEFSDNHIFEQRMLIQVCTNVQARKSIAARIYKVWKYMMIQISS